MDDQIRGLSLKHRSKKDIVFLEELEKYFNNRYKSYNIFIKKFLF